MYYIALLKDCIPLTQHMTKLVTALRTKKHVQKIDTLFTTLL